MEARGKRLREAEEGAEGQPEGEQAGEGERVSGGEVGTKAGERERVRGEGVEMGET